MSANDMTSTGLQPAGPGSVVPGGAPSLRPVPTIDECHFEYPPIPPPNVVCWHPDSDEDRQLWAIGRTREEAYRNMLAQMDGDDLWNGDHERDMAGCGEGEE